MIRFLATKSANGFTRASRVFQRFARSRTARIDDQRHENAPISMDGDVEDRAAEDIGNEAGAQELELRAGRVRPIGRQAAMSARPLKTSMPASVTMKDGIL